jgi:hypothetical protein
LHDAKGLGCRDYIERFDVVEPMCEFHVSSRIGQRMILHRSVRQSRPRAGFSASVQRPALRFGFPALLGLVARRPTRSAHFVRYPQTAGDKSVDEARCARGPQAPRCSPPHRRCATCPGTPLLNRRLGLNEKLTRCLSGGRHAVGAICGATRSAGPRSARAARFVN